MTIFLGALSGFNLVLALVALQRAIRLGTAQGRAWWASRRLYTIALLTAWTLPVVCVVATGWAWWMHSGADPAGGHWAGPAILTPALWLLVMGAFFAIVDVAEDGVLDFGRGRRGDVSRK